MLGVITDLTSMGAAGVMGAMWLWERRSSAQRERELSESHERIMRDEQRLDKLTQVVEQATAAITRFEQTQREMSGFIKHLLKEIHHGSDTAQRGTADARSEERPETRHSKSENRNNPQ